MEIKCNIMWRKRGKSYLILWVCLLVYLSAAEVTTAHAGIGCSDCASNENQTVDYRDDPCSSDFLRTVAHGVLPVLGACEASAPVADEVTNTIVRLVPKLNLYDYLVIVCPTGTALNCLYAIYIVERRGNMIVSNSKLTRASVAALQSIFTTVEILESKTGHEGSRIARELDTGSGSGFMGSGMGSTSPPTNSLDKSSDLSGLEEWHIGLISFGILFVLFCCIFTVMVLYFVHKRRLRTHPNSSSFPITFDNGDLELHPISPQMPKKISRFSFKQFTSPLLTNLLDINKLKTMLDNYKSIEEEYSKLPGKTVTMEHIPAGAIHKNRYADILPNPRTRVALYLQNGVPNSDYINANYIRGYRAAVKQYIATQGPLTGTIEDFWRLVWEQRCSTIVMLTNLVEGGKDKCCQYWPDENNGTLVFGDLIITLSRTEAKNNSLITTLHVQHKDKAVSREITHYWFTSWPDHGVPESTIPVIAFIREVNNHQNEIPGPILVHCSAGIGRTGVFISSNIGMKHLEENCEVDILKIVSMLRQDRGGMVQTVSQYHFVYKLLYDYSCYLQRMNSSQLPQLQQQQLQKQTDSERSLNDISDTATDHGHHDSQSSLII